MRNKPKQKRLEHLLKGYISGNVEALEKLEIVERKINMVWTLDLVDKVFDNVKEKLKRPPTATEFRQLYYGAYEFILDGRYRGVKDWKSYVILRGCELSQWTKEKVDKVFNKLMKRLSRVPTTREFYEDSPGAFGAIKKGRYNSRIKRYGDYLKERKCESAPRKKWAIVWTSERVDECFDKLKRKLKRNPTEREFTKEGRGAIRFIYTGRYGEDVKNWNQYLSHRKVGIYGWNRNKIDAVFDGLRNELKKTPTQDEFREKYSGALDVIKDGRYCESVKSWNDYLKYRGLTPNHEKGIWNPENIEKAYFETKNIAGNTITLREFRTIYPGAFLAITKGRYIQEISKWSDFVRYMESGVKSQRDEVENLLEGYVNDK